MALVSGLGPRVAGRSAWLVGTNRVVRLWELAEGDGQWASTVPLLGVDCATCGSLSEMPANLVMNGGSQPDSPAHLAASGVESPVCQHAGVSGPVYGPACW